MSGAGRGVAAVLWLAWAILGWACASGRPPDWIDGSAEHYPRERYWIGVGEGDDLDTARARARAEIARIFEVRIRDTVTDRQSQTRVGGAARLEERLDVVSRSEATGTFEGVEIAETWTDPETGRRYALAVLDLPKAHARFRERAEERDRAARTLAEQARAESDPLDAARGYLRALRAADERDLWARRAALLRGGARAPAGPGAATADLEAALAASLAQLHFAVRATETGAGAARRLPELEGDLSELFTSFGFPTVDGGTPGASGLLVACRLGIEPVDRGDPRWAYVRWDGTCDVSRSGEVWIATSLSGSESHSSAETARTKARAIARRSLVDALREQLREKLEGED